MDFRTCELGGIFKKVSTRYELFAGKAFGKSIYDGEKYFTKDILEQIDEYTKQKFSYRRRTSRRQIRVKICVVQRW